MKVSKVLDVQLSVVEIYLAMSEEERKEMARWCLDYVTAEEAQLHIDRLRWRVENESIINQRKQKND